jgi:phage shock protein PspC (stress-responsive transcriptional regulator)
MALLIVKDLVERSAFGVCSYVGDVFGINSAKIRLYFIYTTFVAMGSPIILYLFLAFWINIKKYIRRSYAIWS